MDYRDNPATSCAITSSGLILLRQGGVLLLRPVVDFYSGVDIAPAFSRERLPNGSRIFVSMGDQVDRS